jgi:hypothetical protein
VIATLAGIDEQPEMAARNVIAHRGSAGEACARATPESWRDKLACYRAFLDAPVVDIGDPRHLTPAEHRALSARLDAANMALYRVADGAAVDHEAVLALGRQFGLNRAERNLCADEDAVSDITVCEDDLRRRYIPYTTRALSWHTDGYYNPMRRAIRSFILHCDTPAFSGGSNQFLDHEILFGLLCRDANIRIDTLFEDDAFAIPANIDEGTELRERCQGPVFRAHGKAVEMRFSARQRNIEWKNDGDLLTAVEAIRYYLNHSDLVLTSRLEPGMGVISRNVLHRRDAFVDAQGVRRLFLRARFFDTVDNAVLTGSRDDLAE